MAGSGWNPSRDTVRRFSLPSRPQNTATDSAAAEAENKPSPVILLVEDNQADARLIREALEEHCVGCELVVMSDGQAAIDFMTGIEGSDEPCPGLLIVDLNLPRKSGTDVLRFVRTSEKCRNAPVVILTSSDSQRDKDNAAATGEHRYLRKPSDLNEFLSFGAIFKAMLL